MLSCLFPAFHIPLIIARKQLKILEICTLFQPIKLQIFCILTIIGQHVYYNCLLTRLWRQKLWNEPHLSNQAVFLRDRKAKTKISISITRKELSRWNKKHFISFFKGFSVAKNCLRSENAPLNLQDL